VDNNFEQYKIAVDAAEKTTDRRNQSNTLYMAVVSLILTALFLGFQCSKEEINNVGIPQMFLAILGFFVTLIWIGHMAYFKKMIKLKFTAVKELEDYLELIPLYTNKDIGRKSISLFNHFSNNSSLEKMIPILFCNFFVIFAVLKIVNLSICPKFCIDNNYVLWIILIILICFLTINLYRYEAKVNFKEKDAICDDELFQKMLNFKAVSEEKDVSTTSQKTKNNFN
jgi:hypothetical protein